MDIEIINSTLYYRLNKYNLIFQTATNYNSNQINNNYKLPTFYCLGVYSYCGFQIKQIRICLHTIRRGLPVIALR